MTNLRRLPALIGIASVAAAIALPPGPEISLVRPEVYRIRVGADTVWFCAAIHPYPAKATYTFARSSRRWAKSRRLSSACAASAAGLIIADKPTRIGPRVVVSIQRPDTQSHTRAFLSVYDSVRRRRIDLRGPVPQPNLRPLVDRSYNVEDDTISVSIGGTAVNDSLIYIGLAGGFAEGIGTLGGVYRIDRRRGTFDLIMDSTLADHTITGLASAGRWLWAGTIAPAEYGPFGSAGLLRMDQAARAWKSYTHETSPLPDALIRSIASDGRVLAVATEKGIAVVELASPSRVKSRDSSADASITRWNVGWFTHAFVGDSLVFEIGDSIGGHRTDSLEASLTVAQNSAVPGHERPVFDALGHVPPDSVRGVGIYSLAKMDAVDTSVAAVYDRMLAARNGQSARVASMAIGSLGPGAPEAARLALRQAFFGYDTVRDDAGMNDRGSIGRALARVGDSTALVWTRAVLEREARGGATAPEEKRLADIATATDIVRDVKDPLVLSLLIAMTPTAPERAHGRLFYAISSYDTPAAWGATLSFVNQRIFRSSWLYDRLTPVVLADPDVAARLRATLYTELRSGDRFAHIGASQAIRRLRIAEMIPELVRLYSGRQVPDTAIVESSLTLVSLTGRADAPLFPNATSPAAWWANWLKENPSPRAVGWEVGERAVEEWLRRRKGG